MSRIMTAAEIRAFSALASQASSEILCSIPHDYFIERVESGLMDASSSIERSVDSSGFQFRSDATANAAIRIAVLDTGAPFDHPGAKRSILTIWSAFDDDGLDRNGHARHCGGIIAGGEYNGVRFGALPGAKIGYFKVLNDSGSGTERSIAKGLAKAVELGYSVVSMSLGGMSPMPTLEKMIDAFVKAGGIVLAAAGNGGSNLREVAYPAAYAQCIAVGSVDLDGNQSPFSQGGPELDCVSYGERILSYGLNGSMVRMSGTSMATPLAAAAAALFQHMTDTDITFKTYLDTSSVKPPSWNRSTHGSGICNVIALSQRQPMPPTPPAPGPEPTLVTIPLAMLPVSLAERLTRAGVGPIQVTLRGDGQTQSPKALPPELVDPLVKAILDGIGAILARRPVLFLAWQAFRPVIEQYLRQLLGTGRITIVAY